MESSGWTRTSRGDGAWRLLVQGAGPWRQSPGKPLKDAASDTQLTAYLFPTAGGRTLPERPSAGDPEPNWAVHTVSPSPQKEGILMCTAARRDLGTLRSVRQARRGRTDPVGLHSQETPGGADPQRRTEGRGPGLGRAGSECSRGTVSAWEDGRFWRRWWGQPHSTWMCLMRLNCALRNG